jgi:DNA-binding NtrC family response regulator
MAATREASHAAVEAGSTLLKLSHLDEDAGLGFDEAPAARTTSVPAAHADTVTLQAPPAGDALQERRRVEELLRRTAGNVSRTARLLGWHRTQLRRFMEREGLDPRTYSQIEGDSRNEEE